jgi:translation initiation factor IF-3
MIAFLEKGDKVKVSMYFRGREMAHTELGHDLMERVIKDTDAVSSVDARPRRSGRVLSMMLSPRTKK